MRKAATALIMVLMLALGLSACGSGTSRLGKITADVWCAASALAAYHDYREHRYGWGTFQLLLAHHNCHRAFSRY